MGISSVPLTAMALRFFDPMTAPPPSLPQARPYPGLSASLMMQAILTSFSPAGPMQATFIPGFPISFLMASVVS